MNSALQEPDGQQSTKQGKTDKKHGRLQQEGCHNVEMRWKNIIYNM